MQEELRKAFEKWGLPDGFRVDNGTPWGSKGDLPVDLALWLIGLGIDIIWIPPKRPDKNGVIERSQGVGKKWTEPRRCRTPQQLQKRLNEMDRIQREEYPHVGDRSRMEAYPDLKRPRRKYTKRSERALWTLERVLDVLTYTAVERTVDKSGCVSLYDYKYFIGLPHCGKPVFVLFDPHRVEWVFTSPTGEQLRCHPAQQITRQRISTLTVSHKRDRSKPRKPR